MSRRWRQGLAVSVALAFVCATAAIAKPPRDDLFDSGTLFYYTCTPNSFGTDAPDQIVAANRDSVDGLGGDDVITETADVGCIFGGDGNDTITAGPEVHAPLWAEGGPGDDRITGTISDDSMRGASGDDVIDGSAGNDTIDGGANNDHIDAGAGNDVVTGGDGHNVIRAGAGNDLISANDGSRELVDCGPGDDLVHADRGDRLVGCEVVKYRPNPFPRISPRAGSLKTVFTVRWVHPYSAAIAPNDEGIASYEYVFARTPSPRCHPFLTTVSASDEELANVRDRFRLVPGGWGCRGTYKLAVTYYDSTLQTGCNSIAGLFPIHRGDYGSCPFTETTSYFSLRIR